MCGTHDALYLRPERLVTFFANHDAAVRQRGGRQFSGKQKLALDWRYTGGIPQICWDEIGMPGGGDPR
jgi:hypothetical protein